MSRENQIEEMFFDVVKAFNYARDFCADQGGCDICENRKYGKNCDFASMTENLYNAGYRKQSEWISVDDGEPEEATNVLCIENDSYYLAFLEDGVWFDCVAYYRDDTFTQVFPTHWMPLPEAPKMKGGAE